MATFYCPQIQKILCCRRKYCTVPEYMLLCSIMDYDIRLSIKLNTGLKKGIWAVLEHVTSKLVHGCELEMSN